MSEPLFDRTLTRLTLDLRSLISPQLFSELTEGTPEQQFKAYLSIDPLSSSNDREFNALALLRSTVKKHVGRSKFSALATDRNRRDAAITTFLGNNDRCRLLNEKLRAVSACENSLLNHILSEAAWLLTDWFERAGYSSVPYLDIASNLRPGPGSSVGASGSYDFYSKIGDTPHTFTRPGIQRLYREFISSDPCAVDCEKQRLLKHGHRDRCAISKTSTVPKEVETDRTICTEPSLNMLFELATGKTLERVLQVVGINLSEQPDVNRILALLGSLDQSNQSPCTIDLKSASDSLYIELVRRLFVFLPEWFSWLMYIRSPATELPDGSVIQLEMISTMGNGYTFPLQTLIFAAITEVCYNLFGWAPRKKGFLQYGVFGDDIICRRGVYKTLVGALETVGLVINHKKSFIEGDFRESCGHDWLHGVPVRPVYLVQLANTQDRVSYINRLMRWTAQTGINLPRTVGLLYTTIHPNARHFVPMWEGDTAGIHTSYLAARHNKQLLSLQSSTLRSLLDCADANVWVYERDVPQPRRKNFWKVRKGIWTDMNNVNWSAVWMSILGGYVRGAGLVLREDQETRFRSEYSVTPVWGPSDDSSQFAGWRGSIEAWIASVDYYHLIVFG